MSEYRAYNGKIDYDVDMWSNGDIYKNQYDSQRVYTDNIISSNTLNTYYVRDTTIDDQFEEQTRAIESYIAAMEQIQLQEDQTTQTEQMAQTQQTTQEQQVTQTQQTVQQQATQTQQTTQQTAQVQQVQQTQQYTTNEVQNLYDQQVEQAFDDIEVLS